MKNSTVIGQILQTNNYGQFKFRNDNRPINEVNLREKIASIKRIGQQLPIIVLHDGTVEEGQHRLKACEFLRIPVKFIVRKEKASTSDLAELQNNSVKFSNSDYVHSFSNSNNSENYILYKEFREIYYEFSHSITLVLLSGLTARSGAVEEAFKNNEFKVVNYKKACANAEMIRHIGAQYDGYTRNSFGFAVLFMAKNPEFDHKRLAAKIKHKHELLKAFSKWQEYVRVLEEIYNFAAAKNTRLYFPIHS